MTFVNRLNDFDNETEGTSPPSGVIETGLAFQNIEVDDVHSRSSPHSMWLRNDADVAYAHIPIDVKRKVRAWLYLPVKGTSYQFIISDAAATSTWGPQVSFEQASGDIKYKVGGVWYNTNVSYIAGQWVEIRIENINYTDNTYDLWYQDVMIAETIGFRDSIASGTHLTTYPISNSQMWIDCIEFDWLHPSQRVIA